MSSPSSVVELMYLARRSIGLAVCVCVCVCGGGGGEGAGGGYQKATLASLPLPVSMRIFERSLAWSK